MDNKAEWLKQLIVINHLIPEQYIQTIVWILLILKPWKLNFMPAKASHRLNVIIRRLKLFVVISYLTKFGKTYSDGNLNLRKNLPAKIITDKVF